MDDLTRTYLQGIARAEFLGRAVVARSSARWCSCRRWASCPSRFREALGLPWDARRQRAFDVLMWTWAAVDRRLPAPLRSFPFNLYLWDTQRRIRRGGRSSESVRGVGTRLRGLVSRGPRTSPAGSRRGRGS